MSKILKTIIKAIEDASGEDIVIIDVSKSSPICDYFVICSANNDRLVNAIATRIYKSLKEEEYEINVKDDKSSKWILIDAKEVIVHCFHEEERARYKLEELWKIFPTIDYKELL